MKRTTSSTELLLRIDRSARVPLRVQLQRELRSAIQTGRLKAGALLPSTRVPAADFELSRGVVVEAYEQLLAEGYLRAHHGSATLVAGRRTIDRAAPPEDRVPCCCATISGPACLTFRCFRAARVGALRRVFASLPDAALDYPDPRGAPRARRVLATYLNRARATAAREDRVVFWNGSAQGIGLLSRVLRRSRCAPDRRRGSGIRRSIHQTYPGAAGCQTPRIPVDDRGLSVERLRRLDVVAGSGHAGPRYPTGSVLSPERRAALLEWAATERAVVIEDDYDAEYRYDREPIGALQGLAPERVVYVGSASKVLSPALRLGWLLVPPDLVADVTRAKRQADNGSATPEQLTLAEFIETRSVRQSSAADPPDLPAASRRAGHLSSHALPGPALAWCRSGPSCPDSAARSRSRRASGRRGCSAAIHSCLRRWGIPREAARRTTRHPCWIWRPSRIDHSRSCPGVSAGPDRMRSAEAF